MILLFLIILVIIIGSEMRGSGEKISLSWLADLPIGTLLVSDIRLPSLPKKKFIILPRERATNFCPVVISNEKYSGPHSFQFYPKSGRFLHPPPKLFSKTSFAKNPMNTLGKIYFDQRESHIVCDRVPLELNPPITLETYNTGAKFQKKVTVIRDDLLFGGTKQRGLFNYILQGEYDLTTFDGILSKTGEGLLQTLKSVQRSKSLADYDIFIYAGPPQGIAQVALGVICEYFSRTTGRKRIGKMVYADPSPQTHKTFPLSEKAKSIGVEMIHGGKSLDACQETALQLAIDCGGALLPFGLEHRDFRASLLCALREAVPEELQLAPIILYTVVGSGVLLNVFYELFPRALIVGICVGKPVYYDNIDPSRTRIFRVPYAFAEPAKILPPYPSVPEYDGKVWEQLISHQPFEFDGENSQRQIYVWNVADGGAFLTDPVRELTRF